MEKYRQGMRGFRLSRSTEADKSVRSTLAGQSDFPRLAGGTIPFIRKYSTIWP